MKINIDDDNNITYFQCQQILFHVYVEQKHTIGNQWAAKLKRQ